MVNSVIGVADFFEVGVIRHSIRFASGGMGGKMKSLRAQEQRQSAAWETIARRVRPQLVMLNSDYSVALAEWDTGIDLFRKLGLEARYAERLLPAVEAKVREVVERSAVDPMTPSSISFGDSLIIRVAVLSGTPLPQIALFVEPSRRREDLQSAAKRFQLTNRQIEVLGFILQGLSAREIAETLCISETTVGDYFKQLLQKTAARNRADMVTRVLNWSERTAAPRIPQKAGSSI
jgi:DNA-binding NarL/FixJ family response regulator